MENQQIAKSFVSLVKTNNGLFKSPKQAAFLLSMCQDNEFISYADKYREVFVCDQTGVIRVVRHAKTTKTYWERPAAGQLSKPDARRLAKLQDEKAERIERLINVLLKPGVNVQDVFNAVKIVRETCTIHDANHPAIAEFNNKYASQTTEVCQYFIIEMYFDKIVGYDAAIAKFNQNIPSFVN